MIIGGYNQLDPGDADGNTTSAQSTAITKYLSDKWGVFTVRRGGVERGDVIRVTPALYNTMDDADLFARGPMMDSLASASTLC